MILVTGATGFLGTWLVRRLVDHGENLRVLSRRPLSASDPPFTNVKCFQGDITQPETLTEPLRGVHRVFHVAGLVDFNPRTIEPMLAVNEQGTRNLLQACVAAGVERVVHVSSVSTLGAASSPDRLRSEADFGQGLGLDIPYPQSKYRGEKVALEFARQGLPVVIANPTFFAGPEDHHLSSARTVLSFLLGQVWVGLNVGALGYTDVRDVADGLIRAMERGQPGQRYILGGTNLTLREYHHLLSELSGIPAPKIRIPPGIASWLSILGQAYYHLRGLKTFVGPGDIRMGRQNWVFDYNKARTELGLSCRPPRDSLADTIAWLRSVGIDKLSRRSGPL